MQARRTLFSPVISHPQLPPSPTNQSWSERANAALPLGACAKCKRVVGTRAAVSAALFAAAAVSSATTKGLNQIVTPDIQSLGQLSLSVQYQNPDIGNSLQAQAELGLTKNFEVAAFDGFKPGEKIAAAEFGIVQTKNWLLSTGFLGWSSRGFAPQTFLEGGFYSGNLHTMLGVQRTGNQNLLVAGASYQANSKVLLQTDFISGTANYLTFGFTYNITNNLQINPAAYIANGPGHKVLPYVVLSWTITAWK